jgi:hypothetical protein
MRAQLHAPSSAGVATILPQLAVFTQDAACASFELIRFHSSLLQRVSSHGSREAVAKGACAQAASESIQQERSNLI